MQAEGCAFAEALAVQPTPPVNYVAIPPANAQLGRYPAGAHSDHIGHLSGIRLSNVLIENVPRARRSDWHAPCAWIGLYQRIVRAEVNR
jgi:hypothetical protein